MAELCHDRVDGFFNAIKAHSVGDIGGSRASSSASNVGSISVGRNPAETGTPRASESNTASESPRSSAGTINRKQSAASLKSRARIDDGAQHGGAAPAEPDLLPPLESKARFVARRAGKDALRLMKLAYNKWTGLGAAGGVAIMSAMGKGALLGSALGSIVPGVGNVVGAVLGAAIVVAAPGLVLGLIGGGLGMHIGCSQYRVEKEWHAGAQRSLHEARRQLRSFFAGQCDANSLEKTLEKCDRANVPPGILRDEAQRILQEYEPQHVARVTTQLRDLSVDHRTRCRAIYQNAHPNKTCYLDEFKIRHLFPSLHAVLQGARTANLENLYQRQVDQGITLFQPENLRTSTVERFAGGKFSEVYAAKFQGNDQEWVLKLDQEESDQCWPDGDITSLTDTELTLFSSRLAEKWGRGLGRNPCGSAYLAKVDCASGPRLATAVPRFQGVDAAAIYRDTPTIMDQPADVAKWREFLSWTHAFDYVLYHPDRHEHNAIIDQRSDQASLIDNGVCMGEGLVPEQGVEYLAPLSTMILSESQANQIRNQWKASHIESAAADLGLSTTAVDHAKQRLSKLQHAIDNGEIKIIPDGEWTGAAFGEQWLACADRWHQTILDAHHEQFPLPPRLDHKQKCNMYRKERAILKAYESVRNRVTPDLLSGRRLDRNERKLVKEFAAAAVDLVDYAKSARKHARKYPSFQHPLLNSDLPVVPPPAVRWEMHYCAGK